MAYHVLKVNLDQADAGKWLDTELVEQGYEVIGVASYVDVMTETAVPFLVVLCRDLGESAIIAESRAPQGVTPLSEDSNVDAYNAWRSQLPA